MRVLYITNCVNITRASGGFLNDYLNDLLFYGLTELEDVEVIDSTPIIHLYKENKDKIPQHMLWGKGFSSSFLIDRDEVDREDLEQKIGDRYFDLVIYGAINRCLDYYDVISRAYPRNKIFLIDGGDSTDIHPLSNKHPYFKRELTTEQYIPIHFAIPESKIIKNKPTKIQKYATIIPGQTRYIFDTEESYYQDYSRSYFGVTQKKAGWDCMRHYEILANYCIPDFLELDKCPKQTLTNLPKDLLIQAKKLTLKFNELEYFSTLDELFEVVKKSLTTKELGKYVLSYV